VNDLNPPSHACVDLYPIHQRLTSEVIPVSPEPLYASCGPRDEKLRRRPSIDAAAVGSLQVTRYSRALTKRVNHFDARFGTLPFTGIFKIERLKGHRGYHPHPKVYPTTVSSYFPTLLHPRSSAGVFSLAHRDGFSLLFTKSTKQVLTAYTLSTSHNFAKGRGIMGKMEIPEVNLPRRNIISGDILEKCSFILNMKEFLSMHKTMDQSEKSTYPAKWLWYLILHGKIPID
jgi:hypothetical protein